MTVVRPAKTTEQFEMLFELWSWVGRRNHVLDGVKIAPCEGEIFRGKDVPWHAVSCAKMAEPIEMKSFSTTL